MKMDKDLIESMIITQKAPTITDKRDRSKYNAILNRIINYIRTKDKACTLNELNRDFPEFEIKQNKDFLIFLKNNNKIKYEDKTDFISLKSKYNIKNIDDLKLLIKTSEYGVPENEELTDSYPGIKQDIETLKNEKFVKVVHNEEKKENTLYYRDINDPIEMLITDEKLESALEEIRNIWKKGIENFENYEDPKLYIGKKKKNVGDKKKGDKKLLRRSRIVNTHLLEMLK